MSVKHGTGIAVIAACAICVTVALLAFRHDAVPSMIVSPSTVSSTSSGESCPPTQTTIATDSALVNVANLMIR